MKRLMLWTLLVFTPLSQAQAIDLETRIKATFVYKFCQYVTWPAGKFETDQSPIVIAIMGAQDLALELEQTVQGRTVNNRALIVRLLREDAPPEPVHVLVAGPRIPADIWNGQQRAGVLTVTDEQRTGEAGIINFVTKDNKVKFDIAQGKAEQAGLKLSSQLLSVARHVDKGKE